MDREDLRDVISAYQKCVAETVRRFGGFVAKYMGDGALVYFGYPEAHEDDAERAVRAGLALLEAVAAIQPPLPTRPQIRVGIATGMVVIGELIGEGIAQERVAVGETLNRPQGFRPMPPNSMVVGELTRHLAGAAFDYQELGPHELKGLPGELRLWRVVGESGILGRFDSRVVKGLTPFVGRAEEVSCCGAVGKTRRTATGNSFSYRHLRVSANRASRRRSGSISAIPPLHACNILDPPSM